MNPNELLELKRLLRKLPGSLADVLATVRDLRIQYILELSDGNRCRAARILGLHRNTLGRHLKEMDNRGIPMIPSRYPPAARFYRPKPAIERKPYAGPHA